jgi:AraC family transcriptional regulator
MRYLECVQKGLDFIEARLEHEVSFQEIAQAAGISPWHFQRIFKAVTRETLKGYIRSRRLARACASLVGTRGRILDIALAAGYDTQESFSRAFKLHLGATPGEFRKAGRLGFEHKKVCIDADYLANLHAGLALEPVMHRVPARTYVGLGTSLFGAGSEKNNVARELPPLWDAFLGRLAEVACQVPGHCYGILQQDGHDAQRLAYCAAVEVTEVVSVPAGMTVVRIGAQTYARFAHVGAVARLDHSVDYIYSNWLLNTGWRHTGGADIETYGAEYDPSSDACVTHYSVPVADAAAIQDPDPRGAAPL